MNLKKFLSLNALMFIPFGTAMLIIPSIVFGMVDVQLDSDGLLMARSVGSMLLSFGLICLAARKAEGNSIALQALLIGNLSFHTIDAILTFQGAFSGVMNNIGFIFSAMHFLFAIGFLAFYLQVKKSVPVVA